MIQHEVWSQFKENEGHEKLQVHIYMCMCVY